VIGDAGAEEVPLPEDDGPKEVFAFFGLAFYQAQVLEATLLNLIVGLHASARFGVTRSDIDAWFANHEVQTLGRLINAVRGLVQITGETEALVLGALKARNYLAHHFFREHAESFISSTGSRAMIQDLRDATSLFQRANRACETISKPLLERIGVDTAIINGLINDATERARLRDTEA